MADHLANNSSRYPNCVWIEEIPPDCVVFIESDVTASIAHLIFLIYVPHSKKMHKS